MKSNDAAKPRAEAVFRRVTEPVRPDDDSVPADDKPASQSRPVETTEGAMDEYLARQNAERAKMAKLKALRLAAEAKAGMKQKAKRKPGGKAKRP